MTTTTMTRSALAVLAAGALTAPVAAEAKGAPGNGHDKGSIAAAAHRGKGRDKAKHTPTVTYTFKGTVVSVDGEAGTACAVSLPISATAMQATAT